MMVLLACVVFAASPAAAGSALGRQAEFYSGFLGSPKRGLDQRLALVTKSAPTKMMVVGRPKAGPKRGSAPPPRFSEQLVEALWIEDREGLDRAWQEGGLVRVDPGHPSFRFHLRTEGAGCIGERLAQASDREQYQGLRKPAAGLLYWLSASVAARLSPEFPGLELTSLVRTWDYQQDLSRVNRDADPSRGGKAPAHVLGLAFDVAVRDLSVGERLVVEEELSALAGLGFVQWLYEPRQRALHVVALDAGFPYFEEFWQRAVAGAGQVSASSSEVVVEFPAEDSGSPASSEKLK